MNNLILSALLTILGSLLVGRVWLYLKLQEGFEPFVELETY